MGKEDGMQVTIRKAGSGDYGACARLVSEIHALHAEHEPWLFRIPDDGRVWTEEDYHAMTTEPGSVVLLAEVGGAVVGFAQLVLRQAPDLAMFVPRITCSVESIGVTAAWQGQGIGRQLMAAVETWARENQADDLSLSVHEFNQAAMRFYRRLGYGDFLHRMRRPLKR